MYDYRDITAGDNITFQDQTFKVSVTYLVLAVSKKGATIDYLGKPYIVNPKDITSFHTSDVVFSANALERI